MILQHLRLDREDCKRNSGEAVEEDLNLPVVV
jgi:hypothetical protein